MKIAIVEDDINMRNSLQLALSDEYELTCFKNAIDALKVIDDSYELIISDINMPKMDGLEFIKECLNKKINAEFIIITGNATLNKAIESLRLGVKDFLTKPFDLDKLKEAITRAKIIKEKTSKIKKINKESKNDMFLASSKKLEELKALALKAAKTDVSVMLSGESGVGKEVFAKFIHENSPRKNEKFVAINMASIPDNLLESELFGYEKGAFTDASATKIGLFELANNGTLFLDEIGEMSIALQAKLLRVLQDKTIKRIGGLKDIKINVRIISASNININENIKQEKFRADLFYRLNTILLNIAPLRERKEEILPLANAILQQSVKEYDLEEKEFSKEANECLLNYNYPGNIRELISIVQRACILSDGKIVQKQDLHLAFEEKKSIDDMQKELIIQALSYTKDLKQIAKMLSMSEKKLEEKINNYNLKEYL
ncbi:sigma-54-dependent transcriptional regulator [Campylobacter canadensis]|uniref:Sigma-54-dependent Fis family transcriptional regulator n=1 Tax=Campylobacter canadensis TaxID=449520 RepID=A0ABS7WRU2_9BACT|nr:sigma-54 dependent transcriptional regulator [Campylobacter canadensis]MBZ7987468.1 sigma-54-dependent Fis family transcriptional regulator [Campylobacter canadensis]MBZ7994811.1 sigma-54-dependent Fis family transcriptional regulator [Campylobacter canadensis]MBZ7996404.1 sigma-54-dependent Fis family transcriptional regulator [Campylobacter canadensis]MBZ7998438.1 sigma-54-dependent Fis family transcriptional regulator [Campylobacter canadensis]MBZ8000152.1 sigma-54-dependent Fis family t